jgi:hypothetical protein
MYRIDSDGAVASRPATDPTGTIVGYFQNGDPTTGTEATIVTADWLNRVQEELVTFAIRAGFSLNKADSGQVFTAVEAMFGGKVILFQPAHGSYNWTIDRQNVTAIICGAGGGGGGASTGGGAGGASGTIAWRRYTGLTIGGTKAYVVGQAGAANGGNGTSSSFGGDFTAPGGNGGASNSDAYGTSSAASGTRDFDATGRAGKVPTMSVSGAIQYGGAGGDPPMFGAGGQPNVGGGQPGYLGGGGGGGSIGTGVTSQNAGAGGDGWVMIVAGGF